MINKESIPKIGKSYHFFDDGKSAHSRHYICKILEIIPFNEVKNNSLLEIWQQDVIHCDWLYAPETDYFIKGECLEYEEQPLYFVRTKNGGWFSIHNVSFLSSGRLDVDEKQINNILKDWPTYLEEEQ